MADNELTRAIWDVVNKRYRSPENLANEADLAPGTVRNILKSGRASNASLEKLAPLMGRSPKDMFVLAGRLEAEPNSLSVEAAEVSRLVEAAPPEVRTVILEAVRTLARAMQAPGFPKLPPHDPQEVARPAE